jgi:hypothetical protein
MKPMPGDMEAEGTSRFPLTPSPAERIAAAVAARLHGAQWNPLEIVPAAIVTAVALFAVGDVVAAVVVALNFGNFGIGILLLQATNWAGPILAAALLGSAALSWNEAKGWSDLLEFFATSDDDQLADEIDPGESVARLLRSRFLATSALAMAAVTTAGSIATVVGAVTEQGPGSFDAQRWAALIESCGMALAVVVLSLACLVIVLRTRRQASAILAVPADEPEDGSELSEG